MTPAHHCLRHPRPRRVYQGGTLPERLRHRVRRTPSHQRKAGSRERARRLSLPRRPGVRGPPRAGASAPGGHPESRRAVGVRSGSGSERAAETTRSVPSSREYDMTANTKLIGAIAGALVAGRGEAATEWLDGRRAGERRAHRRRLGAPQSRRAAGIERLEDVLVLRALHLETHWVVGPWRAGRRVARARVRGRGLAHARGRDGNADRRGLRARASSRRHGRAVRVHRVRLSRARGRDPRRGRRAAVNRGGPPLGFRNPYRGVSGRSALRQAPGAVRGSAGKRAPGEGGGGRGRRERMGAGRGRSAVPGRAGPSRGRGGADDSAGPSASHALHRPSSCAPSGARWCS